MAKTIPGIPKLPLVVFALSISIAIVLPGQNVPADRMAFVDDWSTRHVIFSNPGTFGEALRHGRLAQWSQTIGEPRYMMQQARRAAANGGVAPGMGEIAPLAMAPGSRPAHRLPMPGADGAEGLWGESLSSSSAATVGPGMYPAKFTFDSNTLNCASATQPDYVVFNTSQAGATGGQASILAYDNLYAGACTSGSVPSVYWAYNTSGTVSTSPLISGDGKQVAFVQTSGSVASLVILKFKSGEGTPTSAVAPGNVYTCTATNGACATPAGNYVTCKAGATSCELALQFSNDSSTSPNDTASSPFYDYRNDILWVGDNTGYIHKFTGVFNATPSEAVGSGVGGWPVNAVTETSPTSTVLNAPVYDSGGSNLLFVTDQYGFLHSVTTTGASTQTVENSNRMECGAGFHDGPIVDSSSEKVWVFIGYGCDATPGNSYVNLFTAGSSFASSYGTYASFGNANATTNSTASVVRAGAFDNTYYSGSGASGKIYVCENGTLYQVPIASSSISTVNTYATLVGARSPSDLCSPVSEIYNTGTSTDWIFMSLSTGGTPSVCTGACVYSFNVTSGGASGTPTAGRAASGGSSGIIVDNTASGGGSQIYYSYLAAATATITCPSPSGGTATAATGGGCAVQSSQAALN